jgi:hypothetical protein
MGGMMGTTGTTDAWVLLWILLALALGIPGGVLIARGLRTRRNAKPPQVPPAETSQLRDAKDALRLRSPTARSAGRTTCKARSN